MYTYIQGFQTWLLGSQGRSSMAVTLSNLEQTMDPWMAAQEYNNRYSLLARLPEEILLNILDSFDDNDVVSLCCLRRVSRTFRRIIFETRFWKRVASEKRSPFHHNVENDYHLTLYQANELKHLLQKDGMCLRCYMFCDAPIRGFFRRIVHFLCSDYDDRRVFKRHCKFRSCTGSEKFCYACNKYHDVLSFSQHEADSKTPNCLGHEGSVQLCEHVHIPWAKIEEHITRWAICNPGNWQACYNAFNIECHHPSHDIRCMPDQPPTWPRARLRDSKCDSRRIILCLEWAPHSDLDTFTITDRQVPAPEMRELFRRYREGAASIFLPSSPSDPLPEMACFDPKTCRCLHYETGQQVEGPGITSPTEDWDNVNDLWQHGCHSYHDLQRNHGYGLNGHRVDHIKHWPQGFYNPACLITIYQRDILVYKKRGNKHPTPTHEWLYAMDPDTYPHPHKEHALPPCKNVDCMNYYKRPHTYVCYGQSRAHIKCRKPIYKTESFSFIILAAVFVMCSSISGRFNNNTRRRR
ncbi:hypothetical protein F4781DRAFT_396231 [Annulohypoxylon bovei var. microspora]|nr:hypothetical protein F4781DRAFT_396231 [Annulohypoxylon bovei var. microspora]